MQFYQRNDQALQQENEALEKRASEWGVDCDMLYLQSGSTMARILPPYSEAGVFFRKITKHRIRLGNRTEIFACPAAEGGIHCPVCQKGQEFIDSKEEAKIKYAREHLRTRDQYLYNVIVFSAPPNKQGKTPEFGKVYVMETGVMVHRQLISKDQDPATGWADITNPENGVNMIIKKTGQGLDTKYEVTPHGSGRSNIFQDLAARAIDPNSLQLINLDEVYKLPPAEKVEEIAAAITVSSFPGGAAPTPRPALPTVSPGAAAAVPTAPPAAPVAPAAPQPVTPQPVAPQPQPVAPAPQPAAPAPAPNPVASDPATQAAAPAVPQAPVVPPPPAETK